MKILVGIFSCEAQAWQQQAMRDCWLDRLRGADYRFFQGEGRGPLSSHEVALPCGDGYADLTNKLRRMSWWAWGMGYDYMWKADLDTFADPDRLMAYAPKKDEDIVGCFTRRYPVIQVPDITMDHAGRCDYPCGGAGTWYSRRALKALTEDFRNYGGGSDEWAGHVVGAIPGVKPLHDPRYLYRGERLGPKDIAVHLSKGTGNYDPAWMYEARRTSK